MKWVRTIGAAILGVIAVVGLLCSVIGFWARNTVFDETEVAERGGVGGRGAGGHRRARCRVSPTA